MPTGGRTATGRHWPAAQSELQDEALFLLVTADHVFSEGALARLLAAGEPAVLIDPAPDRPTWEEGTRVRVVNGAVVAFGKHLHEPAVDCGAFCCDRRPTWCRWSRSRSAWPAPSWSTQARSPTGSTGRWPGSSSAAGRGALLSMASKDRVAALSLPPAPERALGWLLGGRDGRLLLVAVGAALGAPADGRVG